MPEHETERAPTWERYIPIGAALVLVVEKLIAWRERQSAAAPPPKAWTSAPAWIAILFTAGTLTFGMVVRNTQYVTRQEGINQRQDEVNSSAAQRSRENDLSSQRRHDAQEAEIRQMDRRVDFLCDELRRERAADGDEMGGCPKNP